MIDPGGTSDWEGSNVQTPRSVACSEQILLQPLAEHLRPSEEVYKGPDED